ncbi:uncharacterized protein LOC124175277 [Neodiprion fabricii]|uniref:uncharacterized protein LOC124175277 n=1 Tax=Neodiprion fabricii TaxID=2872261 RepID=UPI001ED928D1|nr:uncharacterized protein LOC124175277 [Neodiprion fabricii]
MYKDRNLMKSSELDGNSEDDFDFCNTETGQKFTIKWSPTEDIRHISKHRFGSTRLLSRSVPRRKRSLFQYRINRSLNFEIGAPRRDTVFKSPNFDSDESPICNEKYLTRSAKILRSLNINYSPSNKRTTKINKALNFDLSPTPTKIFNSAENLCKKESPNFDSNVSKTSKINKTLNFSSSSNSSNLSSCLGTSIDSIDENQNQTPSHRNRKVKKSLNYLTPSPKPNANLPRSVNKTPMSREEFINNLKHNAETPDFHIAKQSVKKSKQYDRMSVSTPRNLFQDFEDDDKDVRPTTPENIVQFVPESMSAIKKSHKKERQSNRSEKLYARQLIENCVKTENKPEDSIMLTHSDERPATPITNDSYPSPNYSVGSIKQSHKKDKSKKRTIINHSEDEISDSGSIFDYTEMQENKPIVESEILNSSENNLSPISNTSSGFGVIPFEQEVDQRSMCLDNSIEDFSGRGSSFDYSATPETKGETNIGNLPYKTDVQDNSSHSSQIADREPLKLSFDKLELISPVKDEQEAVQSCSQADNENAKRSVTPENVVNILDQIMTDSIKKSHKKIKDKKKKILFKPHASVHNVLVESPSPDNSQKLQPSSPTSNLNSSESVVRAVTPENVNSSRLLMGQYSSVKKSHKKNKHQKIVTEFAKRHKYFNSDTQQKTSDDACLISGIETLPLSCDSLASSASKRHKSMSDESVMRSAPATESEASSATPDKLLAIDRSIELSISDRSPLDRSSPNKRKKSLLINETGISNSSGDSCHIESLSMEYESAEEEFKIFTPIKKRRSLLKPTDSETIPKTSAEMKQSNSLECSGDKNLSTEDGSFKSVENGFDTPNHERDSPVVTQSNSESQISGEGCDGENSNGPSTPKNRFTSELIFDINSIKKSHKKDKKSSRLRRNLNVDSEKNDFHLIETKTSVEDEKPFVGFQTIKHNELILENEFENPKPSTSLGCTLTTTPPNCSRIISFLKLRQADSIKRSHKKIREQRRQCTINKDPDLSDDGSLFDSSDRIDVNGANDSIDILEGENETSLRSKTASANPNDEGGPEDLVHTPPNKSNMLIQIESIKKSHKKDREFKRSITNAVNPELSDDGSICDPNEKIDESVNDINEIQASRDASPSN